MKIPTIDIAVTVSIISPMEDICKELKTMFPADKFIITGSLALAKYDLINAEKVGDIDIILVNPTEEALSLAKRMQEDFPASTHASEDSELLAIFMKSGYKVDIYKGVNEPSLEIGGLLYATIPHIIAAKQRINRMKDWVQLRKISRLFFKGESFINYLNNQ